MTNLLKQLQAMYELALHSNISRVCDLALSASEQKPDFLPPLQKFQVMLLYADSLYETQQFAQSESLYRQALQLRKHLLKTKSMSNKITESQPELASDVEIRFKIHKCCMALKQVNGAIEMLQSIQARLRTPKVNMALGNLYREAGMERSAITCYKEVLRECPLALEAVENLLKLGVKGVEVNALMVEATSELNWLNLWLKAQAQLYSRDFENAAQTYKSMDSHGLLKDNTSLLVNLGYCYHYMCEDETAIAVLQRAIKLDQNLVFGRDLLATLLASSGTSEHVEYLEDLIPTSDMSLWTSEHWVVIGNLMFSTRRHEKAVYFAQQALCASPKNIEALLLKAKTLVELSKYQDAAQHCTEAIQICPFRYDLHQCLVECYVKMNRLREADSMAQNACKQLNFSPHSVTLHASVLLKDPMTSGKTVRNLLEKAVSQDKTFSTKAVCMLVELLEQEQQYDQARQLLLKHVEQHPTSRIHQMLGDCYVNLNKDSEAFHHYNVALRLDPSNQRATEGLSCIGRNVSLSKRESYYTCVGETSYTSPGTSASEDDVFVQNDTEPWPTNMSF
ncbi:anaphase-promoting complex subunit 7 [Tribolium castaneum]|uniref:Anaphase-promoting complex subunit 7-like Protein n=1 Tax=Tribolium castaneum TaxID=7070 RepID=D6WZU3_TRICA|nr:PREDICTED: anaphase-promoting complex subunit 7 [Tribolium castaneum]EFA09646.1 Anaphase-promoting complex subunit 7-like Protein [Tribolium castaneum]|eukprot:XP_974616.1 PREDICTED: anaphase-promoting complex subunit 7 [Tribolium castaneum]